MKAIPVYKIKNFDHTVANSELYVNSFKNHLASHPFVEKPHRHNFCLLVLFTHGTGFHDIDFDRYPVQRGSFFVIQPGQLHNWVLSADCDGYIVFFDPNLYNFYFGNKQIADYPFFESLNNSPQLLLDHDEIAHTAGYFSTMLAEAQSHHNKRVDMILNLLDTVLISLSRKVPVPEHHESPLYNHKIKVFYQLLETHFKTEKSPSFYASQMNISLKHLNRICKTVLGKTATEIITNRIILEAKRLLTNPGKSISQAADELAFVNYSHFTKLFKKHTGQTPGAFRKQLQ